MKELEKLRCMLDEKEIKRMAFEYANADEGVLDEIMHLPEEDKQRVWNYYQTHYCIGFQL